MENHRIAIIESALNLARETKSHKVFVFLNTTKECMWFLKSELPLKDIVLVIPKTLNIPESVFKDARVEIIKSWAGNQSRFSRIKYSFLHGVMQNIIRTDNKIICVLGPLGKEPSRYNNST